MKDLNDKSLKSSRRDKGSMRRSDNTALTADEDFDAGWTGIALRANLDCARLRVDLEMGAKTRDAKRSEATGDSNNMGINR
ncbi:hypothetical protein N7481_012075 [Penicillium waksmanii]|uniref:uncharacterized protein n=1 Tax=Penicillium waksmanii TaxID=69791 RepID=UPI002548D1FB|nr:uncharacterized protein N7481_012075 [Penicillium waksmanii]KAJ5965361.1 hypothetical protein N7481_012075 [Penicillium waksmanii]